jgi:hypothetical protein
MNDGCAQLNYTKSVYARCGIPQGLRDYMRNCSGLRVAAAHRLAVLPTGVSGEWGWRDVKAYGCSWFWVPRWGVPRAV